MDVIEPKDTPEAPKEDAKVEAQPEPYFKSEISKEGVMTVSVDFKAAIASDDHLYTMRGFMDAQRDRAIAIVLQERARLNAERQKLISLQNKNGTQSFLNKIMRRK